VITATELYLYLRGCVEDEAEGDGHLQTPGLWPLKRHDKGEYIHLVPGHELNLPPAPELNEANNPYRGLQSYDEEHSPVFFGRGQFVKTLAERVAGQRLTVVLGASGTGKSSVVKAGLLPHLRATEPDAWHILPPIRPGKSPLAQLAGLALEGEDDDLGSRLAEFWIDSEALANRVGAWAAREPAGRLLLVIDQLEELITLCWDSGEREQFLRLLDRALTAHLDRVRIVLTLRSDFEPQFAQTPLQDEWMSARIVVRAMTLDEYREVIEGPASVRVLYFQGRNSSQEFIDRLIGDVANTPGALPLLSFTLSELYRRYLERRGDDRSLREEDYEALGGVGGSLRNRANEVYDGLPDDDHRRTMRNVMLRMVSVEGGELARRHVLHDELRYDDPDENRQVGEVVRHLTEARLVVEGKESDEQSYVEPAHDELIRGWDRLTTWTREDLVALQLRQVLSPSVRDWCADRQSDPGKLWHDNPRLALLADELGLPLNWGKYVLRRVGGMLAQGAAQERPRDTWLNANESRFVAQSLARKHRTTSIVAATTLVVAGVLLGLTLATLLELKIARRETSRALTSEASAEKSANESLRRLVRMNITNGNRLLADRDLPGALLWYVEALKNDRKNVGQEEMHRMRISAVLRQCPALLKLWTSRDGDLYTEADPDGESVATVLADGTARVWDLVTAQAVSPPLKHDGPVRMLAFSPDGRLLVTAAEDRTVRLWNPKTGEPITTPLPHDGKIERVIFNQDASQLAVVYDNDAWLLWHLPDGQMVGEPRRLGTRLFRGQTIRFTYDFSPDGYLVAVSEPPGLVIRETRTGRPVGPPLPYENFIEQFTWSPDSSRLAFVVISSQAPPQLHVVDGRSNKLITTIGTTPPNAVCFSHGATRLAAGSTEVTRVFDATTGRLIAQPVTMSEPVYSVEFSPDDLDVISYCTLKGVDRSRIITQRMAGGPVNSDLKQYANVYHGRLTRDGLKVITECIAARTTLHDTPFDFRHPRAAPPPGMLRPGDQIRVWALVRTGPAIVPLPHRSVVETLILDPLQERGVTAGGSPSLWGKAATGTARLWERQTGRRIGGPLQHEAYVGDALFTPDGRRVITWDVDGTLRVWSTEDGSPVGAPIRLALALAHVAVNRQGDRILTLCRKGRLVGSYSTTSDFSRDSPSRVSPKILPQLPTEPIVSLWDLKTGRAISAPLKHPQPVFTCEFDPDGRRVITVDDQGTARAWEPGSDVSSTPAWAQGLRVWSHVFSPDERLVAVNGRDQVIRLWDVGGAKPGPQISYDGYIGKMRFDAAGERLLTIRTDGIARIWDVATGQARTSPFGLADSNIKEGAFCGRNSAFIATISGEGMLRLWDAAIGDPITPELEHLGSARFETFDADDYELVTSARLGIFKWSLAPSRETIERLDQLAQVSSGRRIDPTGGEIAISPASVEEAWKALQPGPGSTFAGLTRGTWESWHWRRRQESLGYNDKAVVDHVGALIDAGTKWPSLHHERGEALFRLGRYDDSLADFREELAIQRARPDRDRYDEGLALYWIGNAELQKGRADEADRANREALSVFREAAGEESLAVARIRANLALIAEKRGDYAQAVAQFETALRVISASRAFDLDDADRAGLTFALAINYFRVGRPERTEAVLLDYEKQLQSVSEGSRDLEWKPAWTRTMDRLAQFYRAWNKPQKAAAIDRRLKESDVELNSASGPPPGQRSPLAQTNRPVDGGRSNAGSIPVRATDRMVANPVQDPKPPDTRLPRARRRDAIAMLLRIRATYQLNDDGEVRFVSTAHARMTDEDLALLANMPSLESLYLVGVPSKPVEHRITDQGLSVLTDMPGLRVLYLNDSPFSDAALVQIGGIRQLRRLSLHGTRITDAGLAHLKMLDKLEFLALTNTRTSDEGRAQLGDFLPKCEIRR
jgi:WD40 repeat protein/tetratricopeptide (TPR) repeat protein